MPKIKDKTDRQIINNHKQPSNRRLPNRTKRPPRQIWQRRRWLSMPQIKAKPHPIWPSISPNRAWKSWTPSLRKLERDGNKEKARNRLKNRNNKFCPNLRQIIPAQAKSTTFRHGNLSDKRLLYDLPRSQDSRLRQEWQTLQARHRYLTLAYSWKSIRKNIMSSSF